MVATSVAGTVTAFQHGSLRPNSGCQVDRATDQAAPIASTVTT